MQLNIRHPGEKFVLRNENEWPLARTQWTKFYLDPASMALSPEPVAKEGKVEYEALGNGVTFSAAAAREGDRDHRARWPPSSSSRRRPRTPTSSSSCGSSIPTGKELTFMGSTDPNTPIANGWLRASHRRLDPEAHASPTGPTTRTTASSR